MSGFSVRVNNVRDGLLLVLWWRIRKRNIVLINLWEWMAFFSASIFHFLSLLS